MDIPEVRSAYGTQDQQSQQQQQQCGHHCQSQESSVGSTASESGKTRDEEDGDMADENDEEMFVESYDEELQFLMKRQLAVNDAPQPFMPYIF